MKEIKLTQGRIALVDDVDYKRLSKFKWFASQDRHGNWIAMRTSKRTSIRMARVIMDCPDELVVDHKDHNTLNNQRFNLRVCTYTQNNQNKRAMKNGHSKFKGVYKQYGRGKPWRAAIMLRDVFNQSFMRALGLHSTEEEAAKAYDKAAQEEFGEFAYLNFPQGV